MKKTIGLVITIIVVIGLVLLKLFVIDKHDITTAKAKTAAVIPTDCYIVKDSSVEFKISTIGTLKPNETANIVSEISKKVVAVYMKEGSVVSKGALLFKLDDADLQANLKKLKIEETLASATEAREKIRLEKGGSSQQLYDEILSKLNSIKAEIEFINVAIDKTEIVAPFSGRVGFRNVSLGSYVSPNTLLTTINDISQVKMDFAVPEMYSNSIKIGQEVEFTTDYSVEKFKAKIYAIEPNVDLKTRTLLLRAICENREQKLVPGSSIKVNIAIEENEHSIFIPSEALVPTMKGYLCYLLKDGKAQSVPLKTGNRNQQSVQIIEGLAVGDTVITTNLLKLKQGADVSIATIY